MRRTPREQSVVAIAKSPNAEYDKTDFRALLVQVIDELQGAGVLFPRRGTAFVKPNVVIGAGANESITTDPHFVAALITLLRENGVSTVYVGDSSASFGVASENMKATGMDRAAAESGGTLVNIDDPAERVSIGLHDSDMLESISVPRKALEADHLINFAKLKTHRVGAMTGCVKNWVGFIDQHVRLAHHQTRLPKLVAELHNALPEDLCFADAVIVGEGDGPDLSKPRFLGALLGSNDPVALDVIGAELLGIHRHDLVFPWTAYLDGVGEIERSRIRFIGPSPQEIGIRIATSMPVLYNRFPCHVVQGAVCEGCFAWFLGPALFWERDGIWTRIRESVGTPTVMMGFNATDRNLDKHLAEGPYFVVGDCTPERYRTNPRVVFIPGCCPGPAIPDVILKTCGISS